MEALEALERRVASARCPFDALGVPRGCAYEHAREAFRKARRLHASCASGMIPPLLMRVRLLHESCIPVAPMSHAMLPLLRPAWLSVSV
jgi:hypothetical protein